ncbi:hypothetical protein WA1_18970 [Scytonema hofmannii PCC 7110]|uniref:Uncharacterized protein n=2 Tax=Scytonema hofmannii TaxID=34078 RepID=A0A139XBM4_9CYAN|nr:hypothetical protein WA1_18970 [Scytonema hofmannii PCC 7110]
MTEFGEHLPDSEAQPTEESEEIGAYSQAQAMKKCLELARSYGGVMKEPPAHTGRPGRYICKIIVWRKRRDEHSN